MNDNVFSCNLEKQRQTHSWIFQNDWTQISNCTPNHAIPIHINVFIHRCFYSCSSKNILFCERCNFLFHSAPNGEFHLSPHENIFTIALINIHHLYTDQGRTLGGGGRDGGGGRGMGILSKKSIPKTYEK